MLLLIQPVHIHTSCGCQSLRQCCLAPCVTLQVSRFLSLSLCVYLFIGSPLAFAAEEATLCGVHKKHKTITDRYTDSHGQSHNILNTIIYNPKIIQAIQQKNDMYVSVFVCVSSQFLPFHELLFNLFFKR